MKRKRLQGFHFCMCLIACLTSAWGTPTLRSSFPPHPVAEPNWVFTVGPGTIVYSHVLDLPFTKKTYLIIKFKTDKGDVVEVQNAGKSILLLEGMRGVLIYTTYPERILDFRLTDKNSVK